jgi:L-malate glycosyltransferase
MQDRLSIDQHYWDESYKNFAFYEENDPLTTWLNQNYLDRVNLENKSVFEIGCFPGRYLIHFGRKGMELNGLDLTPHLSQLPGWLDQQKVPYHAFYREDILQFKSDRKYDLVCSFGFIEHFINYREVIEKHIELNSNRGTIIITTPNFRGLQYYLHRLFDNTNLKRHNTNAMVPDVWAKILRNAGYKIICQEYFGHYNFWFDSDLSSRLLRFREKYMETLHRTLLDTVDYDNKLLSPYCGIIASRI